MVTKYTEKQIQFVDSFRTKCYKFCRVFIVIIFLEKIDESSGKLRLRGFGPCCLRICLFLGNMRNFFNMAGDTKKKKKKKF